MTKLTLGILQQLKVVDLSLRTAENAAEKSNSELVLHKFSFNCGSVKHSSKEIWQDR